MSLTAYAAILTWPFSCCTLLRRGKITGRRLALCTFQKHFNPKLPVKLHSYSPAQCRSVRGVVAAVVIYVREANMGQLAE